MPGFSTEKNRILMLTSTCWQEISLSNTVELTTLTPQKQRSAALNIAFCRFSKIPEVPLSAYAQQIPWCAMIGRFCFYVRLLTVSVQRGLTWKQNRPIKARHRICCAKADNGTSGIFENRQKAMFKAADLCFCEVRVVSSTVFQREISCQHVDVNMRMLRFFSVEKPGIIPRWGQSVSDRDFHTCLFFTYDTLLP